MIPTNRPLSPHLQIYRLPLVALMSITHRITGVALSAGTILLVIWLGSAAYGPEAYDQVSAYLASPLGMIVLFGFSAAFYYHLCNGIRHLVWDTVRGFELTTVRRTNQLVILGAVALTAATWAYALLHH
jgi:succinate dehydrogenase / fumarate reductase cytochrome b subunit